MKMYGLLNFNILGFVSWLLSFCLGKMIWWRVLLHNGFRKNCYLNVGLKEKEGIWIHALETLLDYATEQFVEHSIFSCINMTTLRLTRYLTKKKTKQQKQNQRCIKHNRVMGVQEDKTSYHSCKHHWLVAEHWRLKRVWWLQAVSFTLVREKSYWILSFFWQGPRKEKGREVLHNNQVHT